MADRPPPRERAIERLSARLLRRGSPRLQMAVFLTATGLAGFLASVLLHEAGLGAMWLRYPLAVGIAYLVFLLLLFLYVWYHRSRGKPSEVASFVAEGPDVCDVTDAIVAGNAVATRTGAAPVPARGGGLGALDPGDGDGLVVVLVVVLILVAVSAAVVASVMVLMEAPLLLAEVLVDGVLLAGLARRLRRRDSPHWTFGVVRRTIIPLLIVTFFLGAVGFALEQLVPGATTMAEALRLARAG